ncbi:MAG: hypothetical protein LC624_07035 [Halobacteriales archaeon]|nr:hypothetical protein [Halobacteriales archaeon]
MAALDLLRAGLQAQGFEALSGSIPAGFAHLAAKDHWGSVATAGLLAADGMSEAALRDYAAAFHELVLAQRARTGGLVVRGGREVQLGSFGVLVAVFERGAPQGLVATAQDCKRMEARAKAGAVVWCADAPLRKVHKHKGLPLALAPSAKSLEDALRGGLA